MTAAAGARTCTAVIGEEIGSKGPRIELPTPPLVFLETQSYGFVRLGRTEDPKPAILSSRGP